ATIVSSTASQITVTSPAHAPATVDIVVTTPSGTTTAANAFTYACTAPAPTITPSGPTTFCAPGTVALTASAGLSWLWSNGATTQSITVSASGSFTVTVTAAGGCTATSAASTVTVNNPPPAPTITPSGPTTFCTGGNVTLSAPSGMAAYAWSNGATTQSITVSSTGNYSVTVTDAAGCSATSAPTTVTVTATPVVTI